MALDFLIIPTYNTKTLGIADTSTYGDGPIQSPTLQVEVPGFGKVDIPFIPNDFNVITSGMLELTPIGDPLTPLPDGAYTITYSIYPAYSNSTTKSIFRVEQLQEKFDEAFMSLDIMECNGPLKKQSREDLLSVYFLIQGAIAAGNNCAIDVANKLYSQAAKQLSYLAKNNCNI